MVQLEHIEVIEKQLWNAADTLRANSTYASNEYFLPVMGLIFLRHAYSRFLSVKDAVEYNLPTRSSVEPFRSRSVDSVFNAIIRNTFKLISVIPEVKMTELFSEYVSRILRRIHVPTDTIRQLQSARPSTAALYGRWRWKRETYF